MHRTAQPTTALIRRLRILRDWTARCIPSAETAQKPPLRGFYEYAVSQSSWGASIDSRRRPCKRASATNRERFCADLCTVPILCDFRLRTSSHTHTRLPIRPEDSQNNCSMNESNICSTPVDAYPSEGLAQSSTTQPSVACDDTVMLCHHPVTQVSAPDPTTQASWLSRR